MHHIAIISASVRTGRNSHRVALFFKKFIETHNLAAVEILDLQAYNFPVFEERLQYQKQPSEDMLDFAERIRKAHGVLIVTPEYNGGYPASLKNVIDLLYTEWKRKPVAIASVSDGSFGGTQVVTSLVFTLWKIGALLVPAMYPVPNVQDAFDAAGHPADAEATGKRARRFLDELVWCMDRVGQG
jgi:NAD(P)H-dependent FMN reductase